METLDGRLHSYKPKSKSSSKSSSTKAWPYPDTFIATPTSLAEAGFFFKPSKDDPDNVRCFICKKELSGWDADDNPFETHVSKCPKCPWAIARCSLEFDVDTDGNFVIKDPARVPSNKVLEKARVETFGGKKWWPHDSVKNHGATSKKMAKAGFVYTPQVEGDDTATCFYCDLSLSGWDAEDNPTEEHMKRVERSRKPCPFFQDTERPKSQPSSRSTRGTSRRSRAPKQTEALSDEKEEPVKADRPSRKGKQTLNETAMTSTLSEKSAKVPSPSKPDEADGSDDLEEDPSLKVKPGPIPRKSSRKPASKAKPTSKITGNTNVHVPVASAKPETSDAESSTKRSRSRSKSGKIDEKKSVEAKKVIEKPPSNVDGKIAKQSKQSKQYDQIPADINAFERKSVENRKPDESVRSVSRSRSRSTSKRPINDMEVVDEGGIKVSSEQDAPTATDAANQSFAEVDHRPVFSSDSSPAILGRPTTPQDKIIRSETSKADVEEIGFRRSLQMPPSSVDLFLPPLTNAPIEVIAALTEEERAMTVEQWIRHEMAVQYTKLKEDGERRIRAFIRQAEETRKQIEAL